MARILIAYLSTDGHTVKICQRLKQVMERHAHQVELRPIADEPDTKTFDKIVIGASIRYGKHRRCLYDFINKNRAILDSKPNAFFSVNVVARKAGKNSPLTNPYMKQFLRLTSWRPRQMAVFAGKIDYRKYRFWDRQIIRLIMWLTKGPTAPDTATEFTDWQQVEAFGQLVSNM